ncbi:MAG: TlpA disulfide reductase family protein [Halioglobus sp.]
MRLLLYALLSLLLLACSERQPAETASSLEQARGQWVLVNYWAQWCKPCIEEIPELNHFNRERSDVTVLGVNFEGATGPALAEQEEKLGVAFATVADPSAELGIARPVVLPTTLLVDPRGNYVDSLIGPQTAKSLAQAIDAAGESGG